MVHVTTRSINPRGRGAELREEILQAAARLLGQATSRDGVTLRAIAREASIAAPSIYPHFADRDAVLDAVVERTFDHLLQVCAAAAGGAATGAGQVRAICAAYFDFARTHPVPYRILFERTPRNLSGRQYPSGVEAFGLLVDALQRSVEEGDSTSPAPLRDAQALWAALHGLTTLLPGTPGFPWLPAEELLSRIIEAVAGLPDRATSASTNSPASQRGSSSRAPARRS